MSKISYNNYGLLSESIISDKFLASGRYIWMKKCHRYIIEDITEKLDLNKKDILLDIGCGDGKIVKDLSKRVLKTGAIDHPLIIKKLNKLKKKGIDLYSGNFLYDYKKVNKKFTKILIYSLIHYLSDKKEVFKFIHLALKKLKKNGILLIGDIPNISKKNRFKKNNKYKKVIKKWKKNNKLKTSGEKFFIKKLKVDRKLVKIDDQFIFSLFKKYNNSNFETYILEQKKNLPMNYTRSDIKIIKI